jgi:hypothetical protein
MRWFISALYYALLTTAAPAQIGGLSFPGPGIPQASGASFSLTYVSSNSVSPSGGPTYDYGTLSYGTCTRVVVANIWVPGGTISGITIGGTALSQVSGAYAVGPGSGIASDVWESSAALTGTSGDVQVTYSTSLGYYASVALYCLTTTTPTAHAANGTNVNNSSTISSSIAVPSGGGGLVMSASQNGHTFTFTNTAIDVTLSPGGLTSYYGHTTSTGTVAVTGTITGNDNAVLSLASWGP